MRDPEQGTGPGAAATRGVSHRTAFLATLLCVLAFFVPLALRGDVLLGEGISDEISARIAKVNDSERTRAFRDQLVAYLPELEHQLHGDRAAWLPIWNPAVEQGRPPWHLSGFSRAFCLTHLLAFMTDDAFVLYTLLAIAAVLACACFGYGLLRSMELVPAACFLGAVGLSLGVYVAFWLTFALYVWGVAWALGLLWLAPRVLATRDWRAGLGLAACVHGLLMTSYPQQTVWTGWLLLLVLVERLRHLDGARVAGVLRLAAWGALGVVSVAPVYLDLLHAAGESSRPALDLQYFLDPLPSLTSAAEWGSFLTRTFDASWFGDPIDHTYPFRIKGISLTPLFATLAAAALALGELRRLWPWLVFAAATFVVTVSPAAYGFGVDYLGLGISRHAPMAGAHLPLMVLAAVAADRVLRGQVPSKPVLVGVALVPLAVALLGLGLGARSADAGLDPMRVALSAAGLAATLCFLVRPHVAVLAGTALFTIAVTSSGLVLSVPRDEALREYEFAGKVRSRLEEGERYLWIADRFRYLLRPNQEVLFGLASVHTYNTICSRRYRAWAERVSAGGLETQGKQFRRLDSAELLDAETLALAGVGLVISGVEETAGFLEPDGFHKRLNFYTPELEPLRQARFEHFELVDGEARVAPEDVRAAAGSRVVERVRDAGDLLEFRFPASEAEALLFVGQQWHAHWRATSGGVELECVPVEGLYQGVRVPPGTTEVRLEFRPWVRWSWLGHAFFLLAGLGALLPRRRPSAS